MTQPYKKKKKLSVGALQVALLLLLAMFISWAEKPLPAAAQEMG